MDCTIKNKRDNLDRVSRFMETLRPKTNIVCLPELFNTGYNLEVIGNDFYKLAETIPGPTTDLLCKMARDKGITIVGSIAEKDNLKEAVLYDTAFVINEEGSLAGTYRKYNLYPTEHRFFRPGNRIETIKLDGLTVGLAICFDHAFPELFRILALKGAQIIFIPSAVPAGYDYLLNLRTMARAQDNQIFIVAANRVGTEAEVSYCGRSKIVDPKGRVLAEASSNKEEILYAAVDLQKIVEERKQEPVLRCLRPELLERLSDCSSC